MQHMRLVSLNLTFDRRETGFPPIRRLLRTISSAAILGLHAFVAPMPPSSRAIQVQAPPARQLPPASPPEDPLRLDRDVLRVQLWRLSGWDGRELGLWLRRRFL